MARHEILGGKVHVYKRDQTRQWHCSASINGRQLRTTTKQESLEQAKDFAEDWYLELRGKLKRGELNSGKTFAEAAERFLREYGVITRGQRSPRMVEQYECKLRVHLLPFFGKKWLSEITSDYVLFMANTGLRPDEASRLEFRDVSIVTDDATSRPFLRSRCAASAAPAIAKAPPARWFPSIV